MKKTIMDHDKENRSSNLGLKGKKNSKKPSKVQNREAKVKESNNSVTCTATENKDARLKESSNFLTSAQKPEVKPVGFWSKKLQDLEKSTIKNKKIEVYEFSFTDDSDTSFKIKKKPRHKGRVPKKRQLTQPKYKKPLKKTNKPVTQTTRNKLTPKKKTDSEPLPKKDTIIKRERKKSTDGHKSTTPGRFQATAFTSTPAVDRKNLVDPSKFLFLSPIVKEETECFKGVNENPPTKPNSSDDDPVTHFDQETPKIETRLKRISCRRVLRNGKILSK